jgi:hypothetical protein
MTREQILGMLVEGYNLNQIAAIHMINKHTLQEILDASACAPIIKKSKGIPTTALSEPKIESTGVTGSVGWMNEENL